MKAESRGLYRKRKETRGSFGREINITQVHDKPL
jgi:hypothetical protein